MERFLTNLLLLVLVAIASAVWLSQGDRIAWLEGLAPVQALAASATGASEQASAPANGAAPVFAPPAAPQTTAQAAAAAATNPVAVSPPNASNSPASTQPSASLTGQIAEPTAEASPIAVPPPVEMSPPLSPPSLSSPQVSQPTVPVAPLNQGFNSAVQPNTSGVEGADLFPAPTINGSAGLPAVVPQTTPYSSVSESSAMPSEVGLPAAPQYAQPPVQNGSGPAEVPMPQFQTAAPGGQPPVNAAAGSPPVAPAQLLSATPIANVNGEVILAGDVLPAVDRLMTQRFAEIPDSQKGEVRFQLAKQRLTQLIEMKLLYLDATRNVPKENIPLIEEQLNDQFYEDELPNMMKAVKTDSPQQFDEYLRLHGDSIERAKRRFREEVLARQWLGREAGNNDEEITHDQMLDYYHQNEEQYKFKARARWEQLQVRFSSVSDRQEARRKIAWMGNQVIDGVTFAEVAKAHSDGATASQGGQRDWTNEGSLVSKELDRAIFTLPVGSLSPIIEEPSGLTIVRVVERQNAGKTSFLDAQTEIKKQIRKERENDTRSEFLDELQAKARIWNIFDEPGAEAMFASGPQDTTVQ